MNLYLISQKENNNYDTYDSAVVVAENEWKAKHIHPNGTIMDFETTSDFHCWTTPDNVKAELIGVAKEGEYGVICASFNAG